MARNRKADVSWLCHSWPSSWLSPARQHATAERESAADCRRCRSRLSHWLLVIGSQGRSGMPTSRCLFVRLCRTATHSSCRDPHQGAVTVRAADALGPPMPAYQLVAFRVVNQRREVHQVQRRHEQHRDRWKVFPQPISGHLITTGRPPPRSPGRALSEPRCQLQAALSVGTAPAKPPIQLGRKQLQ
jgi:hypothetical protein